MTNPSSHTGKMPPVDWDGKAMAEPPQPRSLPENDGEMAAITGLIAQVSLNEGTDRASALQADHEPPEARPQPPKP